jgi:hypothetical protein
MMHKTKEKAEQWLTRLKVYGYEGEIIMEGGYNLSFDGFSSVDDCARWVVEELRFDNAEIIS